MAKPIVLKDWHLGGISDSLFSGLENSLYTIVGFSLHRSPGILEVSQKLTKISVAEGTHAVDAFCKARVACSDGNSYWFSSTSGKVWKVTSGFAVTLVHTTTPVAGGAGCLGAREYQGYILWATEKYLHRIPIAGLSDWAVNAVEDWATFTNGDDEFHPMAEQNLILYIGDANLVAQVSGVTFTADALDIKTPLRIKALGKIDVDLLIGTYVNDNITQTELLRWNTYGVSFTTSDPIPEVGINAFIPSDNFVLVNAGINGNLYLFNGKELEEFKKIRGDYSPTKWGIVHPNAVGNYQGLPLLGFSNGAGNPALQGIYSFGHHTRNYPHVLNLPYVISPDKLASIEIGAILVLGNDMLISWKDGVTYGIDKLDHAAKYSGAYFETRAIVGDRHLLSTFKNHIVHYKELPTGTTIAIKRKINYASDWGDVLSQKTDAIRKQVFADTDAGEAVVYQVRVSTTANANTAPEIEQLTLELAE